MTAHLPNGIMAMVTLTREMKTKTAQAIYAMLLLPGKMSSRFVISGKSVTVDE